jgi:hypothetical protein
VTFSVTENTSSCVVVRRQRMPLSWEHRLSLTGSRWDILWLSGRGMTPTFCAFSVIGVAVMEKCCDGCGDEEY